jgi:hypothetical protein
MKKTAMEDSPHIETILVPDGTRPDGVVVGRLVGLDEAGAPLVDFAGNDMSGVDAAKRALADVAAQLGLVDVERRSYLELLLASRS